MAGNEPVTSPDQHKPTNLKWARRGAFVTILILLAMLFGNHHGHVEDVWLIVIALGIATVVVFDWVMRRNGLKS